MARNLAPALAIPRAGPIPTLPLGRTGEWGVEPCLLLDGDREEEVVRRVRTGGREARSTSIERSRGGLRFGSVRGLGEGKDDVVGFDAIVGNGTPADPCELGDSIVLPCGYTYP